MDVACCQKERIIVFVSHVVVLHANTSGFYYELKTSTNEIGTKKYTFLEPTGRSG